MPASLVDAPAVVVQQVAKFTSPREEYDLFAPDGTPLPDLAPRTWCGMPAYSKDGNVLCFFQSAGKFKARYATLGFTDKANLDDGEMWPTYYALRTLTKADEAKIAELMARAVS